MRYRAGGLRQDLQGGAPHNKHPSVRAVQHRRSGQRGRHTCGHEEAIGYAGGCGYRVRKIRQGDSREREDPGREHNTPVGRSLSRAGGNSGSERESGTCRFRSEAGSRQPCHDEILREGQGLRRRGSGHRGDTVGGDSSRRRGDNKI
ncbi:hypothetical protein SDC9_156993 [bioreactor metagenome]|uniref:Uncharacterized protein n=1 Tax=bioreactor metagenome TaxID=1076179 RepID=A0A645F611_9ZZZZ